jgi:RNA polymerase sigma factor (sigma-70 family)
LSAGSSIAVLRDIQTLFDSGTASGLSDRQLLERFQSGRDASAESAFEVLVLRHGPMVLQVCHNALGNATDAQDAFQATFLVLVRRFGSIRRLDSVGGWLYGVACRVAARARVEAARRRAAERRGALRLVEAVDSDSITDPTRAESSLALQAEVQRLPEKYRSVVVLCYWQGLTQEQAAAQLGCPLGTVRSRLARARDILRQRLVRRGLAPLAAAVAAALGDSSASAAGLGLRLALLSGELAHSTAVAATKVAAGEAVANVASGLVSSLVHHVLWSLTMIKACRLVVTCLFVGVGLVGASVWAQHPREKRGRPRPVIQAPPGPQAKPKASGIQKFGPAHVVEPPDLLSVEVLEALPGRPISGERLVRPDGSISLGFYGDVQVGGLTIPEVKERIIRHMQKFLTDEALGLAITDPNTGHPKIDPLTGKPVMIDPKDSDSVSVDVTAYNSRNYYVQGDVYTPGRMPYTGNETVLDVINFAGGLLPSADSSKVKLIRSYPKGSPIQILPIDYDEVTMGTDASTNYTIMPNDRLVIPRNPSFASIPSSETSGRGAEAKNVGLIDPISSYRTGPVRSEQRGARQLVAENQTSPNPALDRADPPVRPVRAIEQRLNELEKKLDLILERMERTEKRTQANDSKRAANSPETVPPPGNSPRCYDSENATRMSGSTPSEES